MTALHGRTQTGGGSGESAPLGRSLDWSGLHARLSSAYALQRELAQGDSPACVPGGAFFDWSHCVSDGPKQTHAVNLKDSTDRKALRCMDAGIAGLVHAGGREQ